MCYNLDMKDIIIKKVNGNYKIPGFLRLKLLSHNFKLEYNGKLYDKEIKDNYEIRQISLLVEALNIKERKERLAFIYDKTCELLDSRFQEENICQFKSNKCILDRINKANIDGCCRCRDNKKRCRFLLNHRCTDKNLSCKFYTCSYLKSKGYSFKINDIYLIKYLYNWKQKIFCYYDFFMSRDEVLKDIYANSLLKWAFCRRV